MDWSTIIQAIDVASTIFGFLAFLYARAMWLANKRREILLNQTISIFLVDESGEEGEYLLPYSPLRRELTRAEILGIPGMFSGKTRFNIPRLTEVFTSGQLQQILLGLSSEIKICTPHDEFLRLRANAQKS